MPRPRSSVPPPSAGRRGDAPHAHADEEALTIVRGARRTRPAVCRRPRPGLRVRGRRAGARGSRSPRRSARGPRRRRRGRRRCGRRRTWPCAPRTWPRTERCVSRATRVPSTQNSTLRTPWSSLAVAAMFRRRGECRPRRRRGERHGRRLVGGTGASALPAAPAGPAGTAIDVQPALAARRRRCPPRRSRGRSTVCWAEARPVYVFGDVHAAHAPPSSWHSNVAPDSLALKATVALEPGDMAGGAELDRRVRGLRVDRERARRRRGVGVARRVGRADRDAVGAVAQGGRRPRAGAARPRAGVDAALERRAALARREGERRGGVVGRTGSGPNRSWCRARWCRAAGAVLDRERAGRRRRVGVARGIGGADRDAVRAVGQRRRRPRAGALAHAAESTRHWNVEPASRRGEREGRRVVGGRAGRARA